MGLPSTMRRWSGFSRDVLGLSGTVLALVLTAGVARAQILPPGALEQLDHLVGSRVETFAVLDTQSGASGGTYTSKLNDTDLAITRVTGRGDVAEKRPLGDSGILWSPVLEGGVGYGTFENNFDTGALAGNQSTIDSLAVFLGGGVRFTVWEHLSLAPTFGVIYAHTDNDFDARNDAGREVLRLAGSDAVNDLVNWSADTFTLVPGIELRYRRLFGTIQLTLKSIVQVLPHRADRTIHVRPELREHVPVVVQRGGRRVADAALPVGSTAPNRGLLRPLRTLRRTRGVLRDQLLLPVRRPARDGRPGAALEAGVGGHRGGILLVRQVLGLDDRR